MASSLARLLRLGGTSLPAPGSSGGSMGGDAGADGPGGSAAALDALVAAIHAKLYTFHWTELWLGVAVALACGGLAAALGWEWLQAQLERRKRQLADEVVRDMDGPTLKKILGQDGLPAWVRYPDQERVMWVNDVLSQLWPHIGAAASAMVREMADPLLRQHKPAWIADISLPTFTLGDVPPHVTGIKVFRRETVIQSLMLELEVTWVGRQKFQLQINPLPNVPVPLGVGQLIARFLSLRAGVNDFYLKGRLRVALQPLLNRVPLVGAIKVSFVEAPQFGYSLLVQGGDISFLPGLEAWLNSFITSLALKPYILPEGFSLPLVPGGGHDRPAGMLYVRLIEATNVPNMDFFSKTDAYVKLYCRGRQRRRKSRVINNDLNPRWDEDFVLLVHDPEHQQLNLCLYNYSSIGAHEEIGTLHVPIRDMPPGESQDLWLDLGPPEEPLNLANNPFKTPLLAVRKAQKLVRRGIQAVPALRRRLGSDPCRVHLEVTFYKVGSEQVDAARSGASAAEAVANSSAGDVTRHRTERVLNMLRGGVLYVRVQKGDMTQGEEGGGEGAPDRARQVRVIVGGQEKRSEEADGKVNQDFQETLEFALGGDVAQRALQTEDELIEFEVWDYHWINSMGENLTWRKHDAHGHLPIEGWVNVPLGDVIRRRSIKDTYALRDTTQGKLEVELEWLPILEGA